MTEIIILLSWLKFTNILEENQKNRKKSIIFFIFSIKKKQRKISERYKYNNTGK